MDDPSAPLPVPSDAPAAPAAPLGRTEKLLVDVNRAVLVALMAAMAVLVALAKLPADRFGSAAVTTEIPGGVVDGGEPPLDIVIGNAAGVSMFKGDTPVDLAPHTRVDVARFRLE